MWPFDQRTSHRSTLTQSLLQLGGGTLRMLAQVPHRINPFLAFLSATTVIAASPTFLGKDSCSSSGCHGGGGEKQNQNIVCSQKDQHARAPATLSTARSKRLAQLLNIPDATRDHRCTACHMPWQNLPATALPAGSSAIAEAVSCESCHGPASDYIRSHTRKDLSRPEKALDGLHDLTVLYNRANSCVACHQVINSRLLEAGHPELLFELDGQTASMPRHWREREKNTHAAAWLTGQAAALRELTWELLNESKAGNRPERIFLQWQSVLWVINAALPVNPVSSFETNAIASPEKMKELHEAANKLALEAATLSTSQEKSLLQNLLSAESAFKAGSGASPVFATRAERLVTAIDRLRYSLPKERPASLQERSDELFRLVQSRPDFNPAQFASSLRAFALALAGPNQP